MDPYILDWIHLLARWAHLIVGIAWIGSSFYFVFTDLSLKPGPHLNKKASGETWQVHGGGFYHIQKYLVAPDKMPSQLHWFKYEAYMTWISGMVLLATIYYVGADSFLIDPAVMDLTPTQAIFTSVIMLAGGWIFYDFLCRSSIGKNTRLLFFSVFILTVFAAWAFTNLFGGRAAFLHSGALIGSMMVGNVFFVIIPNQKKVVKALIAGEQPAAYLGMQAKQRSLHNTYLTLPVLLMMISNHFPMIFGHQHSWAVFAAILVIGGLVRHYFVASHAGSTSKLLPFLLPISGVLTVLLAVGMTYNPANVGQGTDAPGGIDVDPKQAFAIVRTHCSSCHSSLPTNEDFDVAPSDVIFDSVDQVRINADRMITQAVKTTAMPLGNATEMSAADRKVLGDWLVAGAPVE